MRVTPKQTSKRIWVPRSYLSYRLRNEPRLLDRTREVTLLNTLLRWFWLGRSQNADSLAHVPQSLLLLLLEAGLLTRQGDLFAPTTMLLSTQQFLVASDHPSAIERGDSEMVLWPNPTSRFLSIHHSQAFARHSRPRHREWDS